jgi:hypothetical protein
MALCEFSDEYEEIVLMTQQPWPKLKAKLSDPAVGKALQDYLFAYGESIRVANEFEDLQIRWARSGVPELDRPISYWTEYARLEGELIAMEMTEMLVYEDLQHAVE